MPGCSEEEKFNSCGPYPELQQIYDSGVLDTKFQSGMAFNFIIGNGGHAYDFIKQMATHWFFTLSDIFKAKLQMLIMKLIWFFKVPAEADHYIFPLKNSASTMYFSGV